MKTITPHLIAQATRVAELLEQGYTHPAIAIELGVSRPRVSQIRQRLRDLEPYLGKADPFERLRDRRHQLWSLRRQTLQLAQAIREDLRELDEEIGSVEIDRLLQLRTG